MSHSTVLITGGAGFIGSHLADELLARGYDVRALDFLDSQVHASREGRPQYLDPEVHLMTRDVRDPQAVRRALEGVDAVIHLAAAVGVGQSMYEISRYTSINTLGTAVLLEALTERGVSKLVVASSMSIYGEGLYRTAGGTLLESCERQYEKLRAAEWDLYDAAGARLEPVPTPESKKPALSSIYALTKFDQERMCLLSGKAYGLPVVALRFFNTYGPRQSLSNPYTGVLAIFASRYLNGKAPIVYEDGEQKRDFVSVHDVAGACCRALEEPLARDCVLNIGSGEGQTIREVAARLGKVLGKPHIEPEITGTYRAGDIRNCFADISMARSLLGFRPKVAFDDGLAELAAWLADQEALDRSEAANAELRRRGLTV